MKLIVGVDLGGSKIEAALFRNWEIVKKVRKRIDVSKGKDSVIETILKTIEDVVSGVDKKDVIGIGIGVPGAVCHKEGSVLLDLKVPGLKGWGVPLKRIIEKKFGIKTFVENDANVFALAESRFGAGKGFNNIILLTLGTGLGGGIIINKRLYVGSDSAAEMGHMVIVKDGIKCNCGNSGCLQGYVSIRAVERLAKKYFGKRMNPRDVFKRARSGDKKAVRIYKEVGEYLGIGLANIANIFDPEIIIIGGGIAKAGRFILEPAKKKMKECLFSPRSKVRIVSAKLGSDAGTLGAALLVKWV